MTQVYTLNFTLDDPEIVCQLLARFSVAMEDLEIFIRQIGEDGETVEVK